MTSDLWKLREWLTIHEAAGYLSSAIGQKVRGADILRLALDGHLKLSVNLPTRTEGWFRPDGADVTTRPLPMSKTRIEGLWDLSMVGAGRVQVEHEYHRGANLSYIDIGDSAGAWVERAGVRRQLTPVRRHLGKTSSALSVGSVLGVRIAALDALAAQMRDRLAREAEDSMPGGAAATQPTTATWEDVTIEFTSDFELRITVKTKTYTLNYTELGFENRKSENPNLAWLTLKVLAEKGGAINVPIKDRKIVEKRMQEIRKTLRAYFVKAHVGIPPKSDPLLYDKHANEYRARFRIGATKSYDA